ncbi:hypothetical protein CEXT_117861 [Caerostris extrusa]|uniref:Uncharacterized protein n=1 Tax=Caerostris extrusa TaxID=172846 RepID=A0AAV4W0V2_CAEEX|nr:hypothetical protein CEXT_117861 [Caerostris extrusa]
MASSSYQKDFNAVEKQCEETICKQENRFLFTWKVASCECSPLFHARRMGVPEKSFCSVWPAQRVRRRCPCFLKGWGARRKSVLSRSPNPRREHALGVLKMGTAMWRRTFFARITVIGSTPDYPTYKGPWNTTK